jgi:hypothetical protein
MVKQEREDIEHMRAEEKIARRAPALDRFLDFDEVRKCNSYKNIYLRREILFKSDIT